MSTEDVDADAEAWLAEVDSVEPLKPSGCLPSWEKVRKREKVRKVDEASIQARRQAATSVLKLQCPLTLASVESCDPYAILKFKRDGVQEDVYKKLRLGAYPCCGVLDLHHHTLSRASERVFEFVQYHYAAGHRKVHIIHGHGVNSKAEPALLKRYCAHWLKTMPSVLAYHSASPCDGGTGALYVLLRKNPNCKAANREPHWSRKG
ncbi:MAG: Smr/MutS family protein [Gammaproteobacteria bacterium]